MRMPVGWELARNHSMKDRHELFLRYFAIVIEIDDLHKSLNVSFTSWFAHISEDISEQLAHLA